MTSKIYSKTKLIRDLGDGLVLRQAGPDDAERLADFNARIHSDRGEENPDLRIGAWTRDLLTQPHPTFHPSDFTIVEDVNREQIVSSLNLISQTWNYAGIPFGVGRPELVGTSPDYRNRGLVRAQFEVIHQWSQARGEKIQAITGIPYYYRQFGYEMALDLGGGRIGYLPNVPELKQGEDEPFLVRPANENDLEWIIQLVNPVERSLIHCVRDENLWRYELNGKSEQNINRSVVCAIENRHAQPCGLLVHSPEPWGATMMCTLYELMPGFTWREVTPSMVRYLVQTGEAIKKRLDDKTSLGAFGFWLGREHPVYDAIKDKLPRVRKPYAWYLRVPNLPNFIKHIAPVLDQRLEHSDFSNYTGEVKLTFYRTGLQLKFDNGRLLSVETYSPSPVGHRGDAAFPDLTFLQLLFGYRSLDELSFAFADCWWEHDDAYLLLNTLFPKTASNVWPVA